LAGPVVRNTARQGCARRDLSRYAPAAQRAASCRTNYDKGLSRGTEPQSCRLHRPEVTSAFSGAAAIRWRASLGRPSSLDGPPRKLSQCARRWSIRTSVLRTRVRREKFVPAPSCACTPDTLAERRSHHPQTYPGITGKTVLADLYLSTIGKRFQAPFDPLEQRERKPVGLSGRAGMRGLRGSAPKPPKPPKAGLRTDQGAPWTELVLPVRDRWRNPAVGPIDEKLG
jgi:hypothetical protein